MSIKVLYLPPPKKIIPPQNKFLDTPLMRKEYSNALTDGRRSWMQWVGCCILLKRQVAELYNN